MEQDSLNPAVIPFPAWIKVPLTHNDDFMRTRETLRRHRVITICQKAACPNICSCWSRSEATFMLLGEECTRGCLFCNVSPRKPGTVDLYEPVRVAEAAADLELCYVVLTSVTRDDLPDRGALQFSRTVRHLRKMIPDARVEALIPDMDGSGDVLDTVIDAEPDVIAHNIEMVRRLYGKIRPRSDYDTSCAALRYLGRARKNHLVKTGFMVGLGESMSEAEDLLVEMRSLCVDIVHIGQYLRPTKKHWPVEKFYTPDEFASLENTAHRLGFAACQSGPLVRSSFRAHDSYRRAVQQHALKQA